MTSHYRADLNCNGALFSFGAESEIRVENSVAATLALLKDRLWLKPHAVKTIHSRRYVNQMFDGDRPMPLAFFVHCLCSVERLGDRQEIGRGKEWVRRILSALAEPFGLEVVPRRESDVKSKDAEIAEASVAVSRALVTFDRATADGVVTADEAHEVTGAVRTAQAELHDIAELARLSINKDGQP